MDKQINSQKYWDKRFKTDWDENHGREQSKFFMEVMTDNLPQWLTEALKTGGIRVCDWGCAEGDGTSIFAERYTDTSFTGIDFAESAIDKARENYARNNLDFVAVDLLKELGYEKKYDVILASNILEHFKDPWDIFRKISRYSTDVFVIMVPYQEDPDKLHFEHFHSFNEGDFLVQRDEWRLVHFNPIDTGQLVDTKWNGRQALAVYVKEKSAFMNYLSVENVLIDRKPAQELERRLEIKDQEIRSLHEKYNVVIKEKENLEHQLDDVLSSRRYKLASDASGIFHRIADYPFRIAGIVHRNLLNSTKQSRTDATKRKIEKSGYFDSAYYLRTYKDIKDAGVDPLDHFILHGGEELRCPSERFDSAYYVRMNKLDSRDRAGINPLLHYLSQSKSGNTDVYSVARRNLYENNIVKELTENTRHYEHLVIIESMSWSGSLQQRPHHLARLLAERGVLVIYIDIDAPKINLIEEVLPNLFLVDDKTIIAELSAAYIRNKYYWLFSTTRKDTNELKKIIKSGYHLAYDYIDDFDEAISGDIEMQLKNFELLEKLDAQILIASAKNLHEHLQQKFPDRNILLCQNAVDLTHFDWERIKTDSSIPIDMEGIVQDGKPIVGYYGAIAPWLDYELINSMTKHRHDLNFVFLGVDYNNSLEKLEIRSNVHFLGPKDYFKLQDYAKLFDCAVIPFSEGDIAKSTSPVKLFEYMAMGIPTVCTRDLKECEGYDYVYMSETGSDFMDNLNNAISARQTKKAKSVLVQQAKENTWDARVSDIYNEMLKIAGKGDE